MVIQAVDTPSTAPIHVNSTTDFTEHPVPASPTSTDGWGELENGIDDEPENDKDGWDDLEPLEETKPTPVLANIQAAQRRPVSQPVSQTKQGISCFGNAFLISITASYLLLLIIFNVRLNVICLCSRVKTNYVYTHDQ